jgi:hypothetical protein
MNTNQTIFAYRLRRFRRVAARVLAARLIDFAGSSQGATYDNRTESVPESARDHRGFGGGSGWFGGHGPDEGTHLNHPPEAHP